MGSSKEQPLYSIIVSDFSIREIIDYKNKLINKETTPGVFLKKQIEILSKQENISLKNISNEQFIGLLMATKKPIVFSAKRLFTDDSDWNRLEFQILGNIDFAIPIKVFDNGVWKKSDPKFKIHSESFQAELLYSPGPLLKSKGSTPDLEELVISNDVDQDKYNSLMYRRLSPLLMHTNEDAKLNNKFAIVNIPGIGCGVFAGKFRGKMGEKLGKAIENILKTNHDKYSNIICVRYDPYNEGKKESQTFGKIKFRIRPSYNSFNGKSQLCHPKDYEENDDDFSNCKLYKIVAWDHFSYPGNNYFSGRRATDDGVSAAASNSMEVITDMKGKYVKGDYLPPKGYKSWKEVVENNNIKLIAKGNVKVVTDDCKYLTLQEYEEL